MKSLSSFGRLGVLFVLILSFPLLASERVPWIKLSTNLEDYPEVRLWREAGKNPGFAMKAYRQDGSSVDLVVRTANDLGVIGTGEASTEIKTLQAIGIFDPSKREPYTMVLKRGKPAELQSGTVQYPAFSDATDKQLTFSLRTATPQNRRALEYLLSPAKVLGVESQDAHTFVITVGGLSSEMTFVDLKALIELKSHGSWISILKVSEDRLEPVDLAKLEKRQLRLSCEEATLLAPENPQLTGKVAPFSMEVTLTAEDLQDPKTVLGTVSQEWTVTDSRFTGMKPITLKRAFKASASVAALDNPHSNAQEELVLFSGPSKGLVVSLRVNLLDGKARLRIAQDVGIATVVPMESIYETRCQVTSAR